MAAEDWLTLSLGRLRVCVGVMVCVCVWVRKQGGECQDIHTLF